MRGVGWVVLCAGCWVSHSLRPEGPENASGIVYLETKDRRRDYLYVYTQLQLT